MKVSAFIALCVALAVAVPVSGQDIRTERVQFERGASSAVIEGSITGYETVDYILGARKGQYMNVSMATDNTGNYFNILAPGENEVAVFNGSMGENQYEGILPESGDYKVRVYMMRSAARRNEVANYRLEMIITSGEDRSSKSGDGGSVEPNASVVAGGASAPPSGDALVPGTDYHATGNIPCYMEGAQPTDSCPFGVKRDGSGSGIVTVTKPDGRTRAIFFDNGQATGYDVSEADPGEFSASKKGDLNIIRIGDERYEIPDAVIFGG